MTTKTLEKTVRALSREVNALRSILIGTIGRDAEGEYRPSFIKKILKESHSKPVGQFTDSASFLKSLRS